MPGERQDVSQVIQVAAAHFVAASARYCSFVEGELLGALAARRSATTLDLVRELQPALGPWPAGEVDFGVASMLVGHLEELVAASRATRSTDRHGLVVWSIDTRENS